MNETIKKFLFYAALILFAAFAFQVFMPWLRDLVSPEF